MTHNPWTLNPMDWVRASAEGPWGFATAVVDAGTGGQVTRSVPAERQAELQRFMANTFAGAWVSGQDPFARGNVLGDTNPLNWTADIQAKAAAIVVLALGGVLAFAVAKEVLVRQVG